MQASEPGSPLSTPASFAPPSPPASAPTSNPIWASDPAQGIGGTDQAAGTPGAGGAAAGSGQQWGTEQAQQWAGEQAQQWGSGQAQAQQWGGEQAQQWGSGQAQGQQWGSGSAQQQWGAGQAQQWETPAPAYPGVVRQSGGTSGAAIAGGVIAIVGALAIVGACALPLTTSSFGVGSNSGSISLFKELSSGAARWYLVEPIGVAVLAVLAGIIVMVSRSRVLPVIASGVLIGFGIQTVFLFLGYWRGFGSGAHAGPAGIVGVLAGLLLAAAGVVAGLVRQT